MFDKAGINARFFSRFPGVTPVELAKQFDVKHSTVYQWKSGKRQVPWERLKQVVDIHALSWDWMIRGHTPIVVGDDTFAHYTPFDWHAINQRFLSLFPGKSQTDIGKLLRVAQPTVFAWYHDIRKVPWEKMDFVVVMRRLSWHWMITGEHLPDTPWYKKHESPAPLP